MSHGVCHSSPWHATAPRSDGASSYQHSGSPIQVFANSTGVLKRMLSVKSLADLTQLSIRVSVLYLVFKC